MPFFGQAGVPKTSKSWGPNSIKETIPIFEERNYTITGITKDSSSAALSNCTVNLFDTLSNTLQQTTLSDGSGNYSFVVDKTKAWYVVAYKAGSPDVVGGTVNTLVGT